MKIAAIYSRVSSDKQREEGTIASQTEALVKFAKDEGFEVPDEWIFQDDGYSGTSLVRPGLERVRDLAAEGQIQAVLIYSPDRLSRKYAYQVLLIEELARHGVVVIFIKSPQSETPEDQLLLQFQGMIAEYERAQITERTRRGRLHRAKQGHISALSGAPYGYKFIKRRDDIPAYYEIVESEAEVVRKIFEFYTVDGFSIGTIQRRLEQLGHPSPKKNACWVRTTISRMLRNPAYKGIACFGKTVLGPCSRKVTRCSRLRGGVSIHGAKAQIRSDKWIEISVPPLINEDTFAIAQELLISNKKLSARKTIEPSVLQGLVCCQKCSYSLTQTSRHLPSRRYRYYACLGSQAWRHPHKKAVCDQKTIRQDVLDEIVWDEVIRLIEDPTLIQAELGRRLEEAQNSSPTKKREETLNLELIRVQKSLERLLSAYQEDLLSLDELRARLPELRQREKAVKTELQSVMTQAENNMAYLKLAETLSAFQSRLHKHAETLDTLERQKIVRLLVREIAVGDDKIIIRHSIPVYQSNFHGTSEKRDANANYLLCTSRLN